jgi:hypothetical protein
MKINFKPIITRNIENMHPVGVLSGSDAYFSHLARKILNELSRNKVLATNFSKWLRDISLISTAYFEDVVSGLGLFAGFRKIHGQISGKKLPFFTLDENYLDNEINIEDLQFLIWTIMQESVNEEAKAQFLSIENPGIMMIASIIMEVLEKEYETAPENEKLHDLLHGHIYDDFFEFRSLLAWLHYDSYLSMNYPNRAVETGWRELEKKSGSYLPMPQEQFIYSWKFNRIFSAVGTPLAVKATDWWKAITENEEILNILNTLEYRTHSHYRIKTNDGSLMEISPILNEEETLVVDCNSFQSNDEKKEKGTIFAALVKFKDLWQMNGFMSFSNDSDEVLKTEKEKEKKEKETKQKFLFTYEKFIKHTENKPFVFFKTFDEWIDFWKQVFPDVKDMSGMYTNEMKSGENFAMFIHPAIGTATIPDIALLIKMQGNELYDGKAAGEQGIALLCGVIPVPLELLEYVIENNLLPDAKLNSLTSVAHGKHLVQDNMWFIVRMFQPELFNDKMM